MHEDIENIVFKGGGVKSYAYVGALHVLEEQGILGGVKNVAGSSAGALYALLFGLNYSATQIEDFVTHVHLNTEIGSSNSEEIAKRFVSEYGIYTGDYFSNQVGQFITSKFGHADVTFREVHDNIGKLGLREIYLTGTDISDGTLAIFSYENTPDMKLVDALRISCSYPLMYTPIKAPNGHYYVDGGLMDNYPVSIFNKEPCDDNIVTCPQDPKTLGIYLGDHDQDKQTGENYITTLLSYVSNQFGDIDTKTMIECLSHVDYNNINKGMAQPINDITSYLAHLLHIYAQAKHSTYNIQEIDIDVHNINAINLNINNNDIKHLIEYGQEATTKYIYDNFLIDL